MRLRACRVLGVQTGCSSLQWEGWLAGWVLQAKTSVLEDVTAVHSWSLPVLDRELTRQFYLCILEVCKSGELCL